MPMSKRLFPVNGAAVFLFAPIIQISIKLRLLRKRPKGEGPRWQLYLPRRIFSH